MATRKPKATLSIEQQLEAARKRVAELEKAQAQSTFHDAVNKHKQAITTIRDDLKKASGKQRGVDVAILEAVAAAMDMKGMTITKKVQQRKRK